jgi:hypothetical protein
MAYKRRKKRATGFQACMRGKLKGRRYRGRGAQQRAFGAAARSCARGRGRKRRRSTGLRLTAQERYYLGRNL